MPWGRPGAVATVVLLLVAPDLTAHREARAVTRSRASVSSVLRAHRHTLLTLGTGVLVIAGARACRTSVLPLYAESIGISAADTALVFGIAGAVDMLLFYPAGVVMDRWGRAWIAVPTVVVLGAGMMALPLTHSMLPLTAVAMVMAFGNGIGSGIVMTLGADASPPDARAQFLGGWRLFADLGGAAGPLLVGAITLVAPLAAAIVAVGALSVAGGGWLAYWVPRFDPQRNDASLARGDG
jgi:MFS family permease